MNMTQTNEEQLRMDILFITDRMTKEQINRSAVMDDVEKRLDRLEAKKRVSGRVSVRKRSVCFGQGA